MRRYQVYLNPRSVSLLDEFEKYAPLGRSRLIRDAVDRLAENLAKIFAAKNVAPHKKYMLDALVGAIGKKGTQTDYASRDDRFYLSD